MATHVLTDAKLWVHKWDMSADHNAVNLLYAAEPQDVTTFGQSTRKRAGGLKTVNLTGEGLWSGGTDLVDEALFGRIGVADTPVSIALEGGDEGEAAYLFRALKAKYTPGAEVGQMLRFSLEAEAERGEGLARGFVLHNATRTATGTGGKVQVGALSATQRLYANLHVLAVSGTNPTLDVVVESDADASAGSETSRITFTQATGKTSETLNVAGAITDAYWRVSYTIGGTGSPSFQFVVTVGII